MMICGMLRLVLHPDICVMICCKCAGDYDLEASSDHVLRAIVIGSPQFSPQAHNEIHASCCST